MSYKKLIKLNVMTKNDWIIPIGFLSILIVLSALFSSKPGMLIFLAIIFFTVGWTTSTLGFYNINNSELTLTIFPDGRVSLVSESEGTMEGVLDKQQWCTHQAAVLGVLIDGKIRRPVIVSALQQTAGDFRRLNMWLRQDFHSDTREGQVSDV